MITAALLWTEFAFAFTVSLTAVITPEKNPVANRILRANTISTLEPIAGYHALAVVQGNFWCNRNFYNRSLPASPNYIL